MSLEKLLEHAYPKSEVASILSETFAHKPLYLNPTSTSTFTPSATPRALQTPTLPTTSASNARHLRQNARQRNASNKKPQPLSARQKRAVGAHTPPQFVSPDLSQKLHTLWKGYIRDLLLPLLPPSASASAASATTSHAAIGQLLASAEFAGAKMSVVRSSCPSLVGIEGICVLERRAAVYIAEAEGEGRVRCVGKRGCVFKLEWEGDPRVGGGRVVAEVRGNAVLARPGERGRKLKAGPILEL